MNFDLPQAVADANASYFSQKLEVEDRIMKIPNFDYDTALDIFVALIVRLESRYEDHLDPKVGDAMVRLRKALEEA